MTPRDRRNLLLVALAAALCFGGSFTCSTDGDDHDEIHGHVSINASSAHQRTTSTPANPPP